MQACRSSSISGHRRNVAIRNVELELGVAQRGAIVDLHVRENAQMVQRAPAYPVRTKFTFARETPTVDIIKRHFCKLVMAQERSKER